MNSEILFQIVISGFLLIIFLLCVYILSLRDTRIKNSQVIKAQAKEIRGIADTNLDLDNTIVELRKQLNDSAVYTTKPIDGRTQVISFSIEKKSAELLDERYVGEGIYSSRSSLLRAIVLKFLETPK